MPGIDPARVKRLNERPERDGTYVLYWMQASQRPWDNHALEYAIEQANRLGRSVLVGFGLTANYPEANLRHYRFMMEGLAENERLLSERGLKLVLRIGDPADVALELAGDACLLVCDRGYLRHQKKWRSRVAEEAGCAVFQVETDVVVPVEQASEKREFAARTIRPKLQRQKDGFCRLPEQLVPTKSSLPLHVTGEDLGDIDALLSRLDLDRSVPPVSELFIGGPQIALDRFQGFLDAKLGLYSKHRNQPQTDDSSHMSAYLHFGHISPIRLIYEAESRAEDASESERESLEEFTEELMVRRELSINYCEYEPAYDSYSALPDWARTTLGDHSGDERPSVYSLSQLERSESHDEYWNAAMTEMRVSGYMHNYMRMYWGKKILEWSPSAEEAFRRTLHLNNKYFLDGRDPNSYANVAWTFGLHDRPWTEREIFGKVRIMKASGLERKCDIRGYVLRVRELAERIGEQRGQ